MGKMAPVSSAQIFEAMGLVGGSCQRAADHLRAQGFEITREGIYARLRREKRLDLVRRRLCSHSDDQIAELLIQAGGDAKALSLKIRASYRRIVTIALKRKLVLLGDHALSDARPWVELTDVLEDEIRSLRMAGWRLSRIARSLDIPISQVRSVK